MEKKKTIAVIGLGETGFPTFLELKRVIAEKNLPYTVYGVEVDKLKVEKYRAEGHFILEEIPSYCEYYIICLYHRNHILDVLQKCYERCSEDSLISIESTLHPFWINDICYEGMDGQIQKLVTCPHRLVPYDKNYWVFNLDRLVGGFNSESTDRGYAFYNDFFQQGKLHKTSFTIAALSKVVENSYRFMEIVIAQELARSCDRLLIDYDELRSAVNTKWNMSLKEAKDGVGGKCLPKDMQFLTEYFCSNGLLKYMMMLNEDYKKDAQNGA